jgi:all-trans-retinol dehydrogenase (NAD+)
VDIISCSLINTITLNHQVKFYKFEFQYSTNQHRPVMSNHPYLKFLLGTFGATYAARETWIWYNQKNLKKETVLITGGTSGIGLLIAKQMASEGATVVIWARDKKKLEEASTEIRKDGGKVYTYSVDVSDREAVYKTADIVRREVGDITILLNNAGIVRGATFLDSKDDDIKKTFDVNIISHYYTTRAFLPAMLKKGYGHIVTLSSAGGIIGGANLTDYSASKFATFGFHEALRVELRNMGHATKRWRNRGVQCTIVCPYFIATGMFDGVKDNNVPFLMPILTTEGVAKRTVSAIKRGDGLVILPAFPWLIFATRFLLPTKGYDYVMYDLMGCGKLMDGYSTTDRTEKSFEIKSKL